ncbi:MAG TPA: twin-arginine translocase TatA/TatE family subunit [Erythrobacter sp.]|nr:twin-arginine translocase TatA/TatE family subunit [Erythrobacter sp.]
MGLSVWQLAIVAVLILILFGRGRISEMMGDFGKGIKSFKQGMNEEGDAAKEAPAQIEASTNDAPKPTEAASDVQPAERGDSTN